MTLKVFHNDVVDWIVAESPEDADKLCLEHYGECTADYDMEWLEEIDSLTIRFEEECEIRPWPEDHLVTLEDGVNIVTAMPAAWAKWNRRGFLCSTEW